VVFERNRYLAALQWHCGRIDGDHVAVWENAYVIVFDFSWIVTVK